MPRVISMIEFVCLKNFDYHISDGDPTDNDLVEEDTQFDLRNRLSSSEHQRLLFVNS